MLAVPTAVVHGSTVVGLLLSVLTPLDDPVITAALVTEPLTAWIQGAISAGADLIETTFAAAPSASVVAAAQTITAWNAGRHTRSGVTLLPLTAGPAGSAASIGAAVFTLALRLAVIPWAVDWELGWARSNLATVVIVVLAVPAAGPAGAAVVGDHGAVLAGVQHVVVTTALPGDAGAGRATVIAVTQPFGAIASGLDAAASVVAVAVARVAL